MAGEDGRSCPFSTARERPLSAKRVRDAAERGCQWKGMIRGRTNFPNAACKEQGLWRLFCRPISGQGYRAIWRRQGSVSAWWSATRRSHSGSGAAVRHPADGSHFAPDGGPFPWRPAIYDRNRLSATDSSDNPARMDRPREITSSISATRRPCRRGSIRGVHVEPLRLIRHRHGGERNR